MKHKKIKFFLALVASIMCLTGCNMKNPNNNSTCKKYIEEELFKIKFMDYEHLIDDKISHIAFLEGKTDVLNSFIKFFYFGNYPTNRDNLLSFFKNKGYPVFEKGQNISVKDILFIYNDSKLISINIIDK